MKLFFSFLCGLSLMSSFAIANTETSFCKDCSLFCDCGCSDNNCSDKCGCGSKESRSTSCPCCNGSERGKGKK